MVSMRLQIDIIDRCETKRSLLHSSQRFSQFWEGWAQIFWSVHFVSIVEVTGYC